jgi:uncharacterized tellurite resistance protein B-like protein
MRSIRQLLGLETQASDPRETDSVRRIAAELGRLGPDEARYIAAFAYVLARVAHADLDVSEAEVREMERLVAGMGEFDPEKTTLIVEIARHQVRVEGGTEDYVVTRQFRELSSKAQRIGLLRCLFAVAAADDEVSHEEEQSISQIGAELGLTGPEVASVRSSYRDKLATLKGKP